MWSAICWKNTVPLSDITKRSQSQVSLRNTPIIGWYTARLSRLYDSLCDGVIPAEAFNRKESEYKAELADLTAALAECNRDQHVESHEGLQILELANRLYPTYLDMEHEKRAKLLKLLASNYVLDGVTLSATYRKPFSLFQELPSRPVKRPFPDYPNFFYPSKEVQPMDRNLIETSFESMPVVLVENVDNCDRINDW